MRFENIGRFTFNHRIIPGNNKICLMNITPGEAFCDSRIFIIGKEYLNDFVKCKHHIDERVSLDFERVFMHYLNSGSNDCRTLTPLAEPRCHEICGTTGKPYPLGDNDNISQVKYFVSQLLYNIKIIKGYIKNRNEANKFDDFKKNPEFS